MKAFYLTANGDMDATVVGDLDAPAMQPGCVRVQVKASALNHLDIWVRKGRPGAEPAFPHILGSDAAGVVLECADDVHGFEQGQSVILNPGVSCGCCEWCKKGEQSECPAFDILGLGRTGVHAEEVVVPAKCVYAKPDHLSWFEAAALSLAHVTASRMLFSKARLEPGETVLIHGIGGGAALASLQLAVAAGAKTIVTSSSPEKLKHAATLGASEQICYAEDTVADAVKELTDGRGVDVIIDSVGAATWETNFRCARRGGRMVHCGVTSGAKVETNISLLYWNHLNIMGSTMGSDADYRRMLKMVETNTITPVVDEVVPLVQAKAAMQRMEAGEQFGKLVLSMTEDA